MSFLIIRNIESGEFLVIDQKDVLLTGIDTMEKALFHLKLLAKEEFDFELLYAAYPRKRGKTPGLKWLKVHCKSKTKFDLLMKCIENYSTQLRVEGTADEFVLHFGTFLKRHEDFKVTEVRPIFPFKAPGDLPFSD